MINHQLVNLLQRAKALNSTIEYLELLDEFYSIPNSSDYYSQTLLDEIAIVLAGKASQHHPEVAHTNTTTLTKPAYDTQAPLTNTTKIEKAKQLLQESEIALLQTPPNKIKFYLETTRDHFSNALRYITMQLENQLPASPTDFTTKIAELIKPVSQLLSLFKNDSVPSTWLQRVDALNQTRAIHQALANCAEELETSPAREAIQAQVTKLETAFDDQAISDLSYVNQQRHVIDQWCALDLSAVNSHEAINQRNDLLKHSPNFIYGMVRLEVNKEICLHNVCLRAIKPIFEGLLENPINKDKFSHLLAANNHYLSVIQALDPALAKEYQDKEAKLGLNKKLMDLVNEQYLAHQPIHQPDVPVYTFTKPIQHQAPTETREESQHNLTFITQTLEELQLKLAQLQLQNEQTEELISMISDTEPTEFLEALAFKQEKVRKLQIINEEQQNIQAGYYQILATCIELENKMTVTPQFTQHDAVNELQASTKQALSKLQTELANTTEKLLYNCESILNLVEINVNSEITLIKHALQQAYQLGHHYNATLDSNIKNHTLWQQLMTTSQSHLDKIEQWIPVLEKLSHLEKLSGIAHRSIALFEHRDQLLAMLQHKQKHLIPLTKGDFSGISIHQENEFFEELCNQAARALLQGLPRLHILDTLLTTHAGKNFLQRNTKHKERYQFLHASTIYQMTEQLVNDSRQLFASIPFHEFSNLDANITHIQQMLAAGNELQSFVVNDILTQTDLAARTLTFERWIWITKQCYELNDMHSTVSIHDALQSPALKRLFSTIAGLSPAAATTFAQLNNGLTPHELFNHIHSEYENGRLIIPHLTIYLHRLRKIANRNHLVSTEKTALLITLETLLTTQKNFLARTHVSHDFVAQLFAQLEESRIDADKWLDVSHQLEPEHNHPHPSTVLRGAFATALMPNKQFSMGITQEFLFNFPHLVTVILNKRLQLAPTITPEAVQAVNDVMTRPLDKPAFINALRQIGLDLSPSEFDQVFADSKQHFYHHSLANKVLARIIKGKRLKAANHYFAWKTSTLSQIEKINDSTIKAMPDKELRKHLRNVGIEVTDEQLRKIQDENKLLQSKSSVAAPAKATLTEKSLEWMRNNPKKTGAIGVAGVAKVATCAPLVALGIMSPHTYLVVGTAKIVGGALAGAFFGKKAEKYLRKPSEPLRKALG